MTAAIQQRRVLDAQILSGLSAGLTSPLPVRRQDPPGTHPALPQKTTDRFECGPIGERLRRRSARASGQRAGDFHRTIITTGLTPDWQMQIRSVPADQVGRNLARAPK